MYSFFSSFSPVSRILAALTTTTKSPASRCGEKPGLVFPRSTNATRDARRPRTLPSASATYQRRAARAASVLRLLVVRVIDIDDQSQNSDGTRGQPSLPGSRRKWRGRRDSNPPPPPGQAGGPAHRNTTPRNPPLGTGGAPRSAALLSIRSGAPPPRHPPAPPRAPPARHPPAPPTQ